MISEQEEELEDPSRLLLDHFKEMDTWELEEAMGLRMKVEEDPEDESS